MTRPQPIKILQDAPTDVMADLATSFPTTPRKPQRPSPEADAVAVSAGFVDRSPHPVAEASSTSKEPDPRYWRRLSMRTKQLTIRTTQEHFDRFHELAHTHRLRHGELLEQLLVAFADRHGNKK